MLNMEGLRSALDRLALDNNAYNGAATTRWINPDITPLAPSRRTWGHLAYLGWGSIAKYAAQLSLPSRIMT